MVERNDMSDDDAVIDFYLTLDRRDIVPANVLVTLARSMPLILNEFVAEYSDMSAVDWGFTTLNVGSLRAALAPVQEVADDDTTKLRLVTETFRESTAAIQSGSDIADVFPERALEPVSRMLRLLDREVTSIRIGTSSGTTTLTKEGAGSHDRKKVRRQSLGTVTGTIQGVSFASTPPHFSLRRMQGNRMIKCYFDEDTMADGVIRSLRRQVRVHGTLVKDDLGVIQRIEVGKHPEEVETPSKKVTIAELVGIAPGLTEGLPSEQWLRRQRDER